MNTFGSLLGPHIYTEAGRLRTVSDDVPSDVQAVLTQLLAETETAIQAGELDTARRTIETVMTVSRNKLPDGELRAQLRHGCTAVTGALAETDGVESAVAAAYVQAMAERLPE